ncbi:GNAT family N-acetyltransferase [Zalerion maritima]|uniref:GNAT family N-acetyltransferase n=1 Tax=Zalerion maritima TaxID=339359 RepID=A0AAD5RFV6_9PEZI|nr:GNAT family N-acetyltransferase [Zalerion maritima]
MTLPQPTISILTGAELCTQPALERLAFQFRYRVFVEKLGWQALRREDRLETDAFDTDEAVHFIISIPKPQATTIATTTTTPPSSNSDDDLQTRIEVVAYSRLLPTTRPHLLSTVYPHLLNDPSITSTPPTGNHIWEWTRTTAIPQPTTKKNMADDVSGFGFAVNPVGRLLLLAVVEWAVSPVAHGRPERGALKALAVQCPPTLALALEPLGGRAEVLADPSVTEEKEEVVPMLVHVNERSPPTMRSVFGMTREERRF